MADDSENNGSAGAAGAAGQTQDGSNPSPTGGIISLTALGQTGTGAGGGGVAGSGGGGGGPPNIGSPAGLQPFTLDATREKIAFILLGILAAIIGIEALGSAIFAGDCWTFGKDSCAQAQASLGILTTILGTVFTAMVGLVGSVVGFYFGSQKQQP